MAEMRDTLSGTVDYKELERIGFQTNFTVKKVAKMTVLDPARSF